MREMNILLAPVKRGFGTRKEGVVRWQVRYLLTKFWFVKETESNVDVGTICWGVVVGVGAGAGVVDLCRNCY